MSSSQTHPKDLNELLGVTCSVQKFLDWCGEVQPFLAVGLTVRAQRKRTTIPSFTGCGEGVILRASEFWVFPRALSPRCWILWAVTAVLVVPALPPPAQVLPAPRPVRAAPVSQPRTLCWDA